MRALLALYRENKDLIDNIKRKWHELDDLSSRLVAVDTLLDQLYRQKFEEFAKRLNEKAELRHIIQPLKRKFDSALASRKARNLLERIQAFLDERNA